MKRSQTILAALCVALTAAFALPAAAQDALPRPDPPFKGPIGRAIKDSTKDFPAEVQAPGKQILVLDFKYDGGLGKGGTATWLVDGKPVAEGRIERTMAFRISVDETLDIGEDTGTPVSEDYRVPFGFTGELERVVRIKAEIGLSQ